MSKIDMGLKVTNVFVESTEKANELYVEIGSADEKEILDYFSTEDVIKHFGDTTILDKIGKERVMQYFNLTEKED